MKVAVGFFDGVHAGHRRILSGADMALTFRNHPRSVLAPECPLGFIQSFEDRIASIRQASGGEVVALDFTRELAETPPADFARRVLLPLAGDGKPCVRCGPNWRFGRGGKGDAEFLRSLGVDVEVVPFAEYGGGRVSSTRIRASIEVGRIEEANAMLARPWKMTGRVVHGKGLGRGIGYPTVNVAPARDLLRPPLGVYAVSGEFGLGIANYGLAPTAGELAWRDPVLEIHVLGRDRGSFAAPREGEPFGVDILRFIRPERRFDSFDALTRQIALDVEEAMK